jgi:AsmA protein
LRGTASLIRPATGGDADAVTFNLPFLVRGSWDDPTLAPDPSAFIRRSETSPSLNAAGSAR